MRGKLILTVGPSSSGKSEYARDLCKNQNNVYVLNRDDLRLSLFGLKTLKAYKHSKASEMLITKIQYDIAKNIIYNHSQDFQGFTIIVADTNLSKWTRKKWGDFAFSNSLEFEYFYDWPSRCFDGRVTSEERYIPLEELLRRNKLRTGNIVPPEVITKQHKVFLEFLED